MRRLIKGWCMDCGIAMIYDPEDFEDVYPEDIAWPICDRCNETVSSLQEEAGEKNPSKSETKRARE